MNMPKQNRLIFNVLKSTGPGILFSYGQRVYGGGPKICNKKARTSVTEIRALAKPFLNLRKLAA
jgi:hypothetical protein